MNQQLSTIVAEEGTLLVRRTRRMSLKLSCRLTWAFVLRNVEGGGVFGSQVQRFSIFVGGGVGVSRCQNVTRKPKRPPVLSVRATWSEYAICRDRLGNLLHFLI